MSPGTINHLLGGGGGANLVCELTHRCLCSPSGGGGGGRRLVIGILVLGPVEQSVDVGVTSRGILDPGIVGI